MCSTTFFNFGFFWPLFGVSSGSVWGIVGVLSGSNPTFDFGSGSGLFLSDSRLVREFQLVVEFRESAVPVEFEMDLVWSPFPSAVSGVGVVDSFGGLGGLRAGGGRRRDPEDGCGVD